MLFAEEFALQSWVSLIIQAGFAVAVAWYLLSIAIPKMQAEFTAALVLARADAAKATEREKEVCGNLIQIILDHNEKEGNIKLERIESINVKLDKIELMLHDALKVNQK